MSDEASTNYAIRLEAPAPAPRLVDTRLLAKDLADLGVKEKWARLAADAGDIPCVRIGKKILFNPVAVREHLVAQAAQLSPKL